MTYIPFKEEVKQGKNASQILRERMAVAMNPNKTTLVQKKVELEEDFAIMCRKNDVAPVSSSIESNDDCSREVLITFKALIRL